MLQMCVMTTANQTRAKVSFSRPKLLASFALTNIVLVLIGMFWLGQMAGGVILIAFSGAALAFARFSAKPIPDKAPDEAAPPKPLLGQETQNADVRDSLSLEIDASAMMEELTQDGGRLALLSFDIDRLKDINGCYGYAAGDFVLDTIAERLRTLTTDSVYRLSGDRFVVLHYLKDSDDQKKGAEEAELLAVAAIDRVSQTLKLDSPEGDVVSPSASVGIAIFPDHGRSYEVLLRCSELAMDEAKRAGGRRFKLFDGRLIASLRGRKDMERELRLAIENNDLTLHYQPQIDLRTGRVNGVEALMRWYHPDRGAIAPTTFIPVAEATGLIKTMGAWLIEEACQRAKSWHDQGLSMSIAVNISAAQLRQQNLPKIVEKALNKTNLPPNFLELELTESLFVDPSELIMRRSLEDLAEMGVRLAIDDFGTGYSSLAYLKRLPVTKIKIDKSFTFGIGRENKDEALVRVIIGLAKTFGKHVLAEGVEDDHQRLFLLREGCDQAQGYFFSRPLTFDACNNFVRRSSPPNVEEPRNRAVAS